MKLFSSKVEVTYETTVFVSAETADEAIELIKNGEWDDDQPTEAVDWTDPKSVTDTETDEVTEVQ